MMHPISSESRFHTAELGYNAFEITPSFGRRRIFVLSVQGGLPAFFHNMLPAVPARVATAARAEAFDMVSAPSTEDRQTPSSPKGGDEGSYWARPVLGPVVTNTQGHFYEHTQQGLRPLLRVVRSPQGHLHELLPLQSAQGSASTTEEIIDGELVEPPLQPISQSRTEASSPVVAQRTEQASQARSRKFFADPGLPRVVEFGRFRSLLASQLSHPERLRDPHKLVCHVQIYESLSEQRVDEFFESIQRGETKNTPIQPLVEETITVLGLAPFFHGRPRAAMHGPKVPGRVKPYERFFSMRVSSDPTADIETANSIKRATPLTTKNQPVDVAPQTNVSAATIPSRLKEVPLRFQNPWEFQSTREEALYDMGMDKLSRHSLRKLLSRIAGGSQKREEFRRWSTLLNGKSMEDQLWSVRPPSGAIDDETIREWARQTLELAGYDSTSMMLEWEIFWRRKGVKTSTGGKRK